MITQISKLEVGRVEFYAMVDTVRDKKNMQFIVVKDFSGKIQLFIDKVKYPEVAEAQKAYNDAIKEARKNTSSNPIKSFFNLK